MIGRWHFSRGVARSFAFIGKSPFMDTKLPDGFSPLHALQSEKDTQTDHAKPTIKAPPRQKANKKPRAHNSHNTIATWPKKIKLNRIIVVGGGWKLCYFGKVQFASSL